MILVWYYKTVKFRAIQLLPVALLLRIPIWLSVPYRIGDWLSVFCLLILVSAISAYGCLPS